MAKVATLLVQGIPIHTMRKGNEDYISLTDIARSKNNNEPKDVVKNWMRSRSTIEFLGLWEQLNNPDFKGVDFDPLLFEAGSNSFTLSPSKWIASTNAIGIVSKAGNNGGTFAHKDIAFEFASWVSSGFKLYLIKEFQRLKEAESDKGQLEWNLQRTLAKVNYHIHTDAVKENLIPPTLSRSQASMVYASEADVLNVALFGMTAKEWRASNPDQKGNIRDHATIEQLVVLSNMESANAMLINEGLAQQDRLVRLNGLAIRQMESLVRHKGSLGDLGNPN